MPTPDDTPRIEPTPRPSSRRDDRPRAPGLVYLIPLLERIADASDARGVWGFPRALSADRRG